MSFFLSFFQYIDENKTKFARLHPLAATRTDISHLVDQPTLTTEYAIRHKPLRVESFRCCYDCENARVYA